MYHDPHYAGVDKISPDQSGQYRGPVRARGWNYGREGTLTRAIALFKSGYPFSIVRSTVSTTSSSGESSDDVGDLAFIILLAAELFEETALSRGG